jgi:hypothetical protein
LQPGDPASRINFCNWFSQSVHDGEVDPHTEEELKENMKKNFGISSGRTSSDEFKPI